MLIYSVEGSVAAGKSSFLEYIHNMVDNNELDSKVCVITEPVAEWVEGGVLQAQYDAAQAYGALFEMYALVSQQTRFHESIEQHLLLHGQLPEVVFCERFGGMANEEVFMRVLLDMGAVDGMHMEMYRRVLDHLGRARYLGLNDNDVVKILYIQSELEETIRRVAERNREVADNARLQGLHDQYERWLGNRGFFVERRSGMECEVVRVRNGGDIADLHAEAGRVLNSQPVLMALNRRVVQMDLA
jgi:deoxyadenosine/deoxycytidine kinase